jgi:hypothetical protein
MKRTPVTINFVADTRMHNDLREAAEADERSVSSLVRLAVRAWLDGPSRPPPQRSKREASAA